MPFIDEPNSALCLLPVLVLQLGRRSDAASVLDQWIESVERIGHIIPAADVFRLRATILRLGGHSADAEAMLLRAIGVSKAQGAFLCQLRAPTELAGMRAEFGDTAGARSVLKPI